MSNGFLGLGVELPSINITGFLSSTWIYVLIIAFIGFLLVIALFVFLFFNTYKKRIILFENISGSGYQPVLKTRARVIKLGKGGEEILKTLIGGYYVSSYGRKMGKNSYWYAKGQDGYWYNIVLGDLDTKLNMLDIEPVDRDVRMFHVAVNKLSQQDYGKKMGILEKYALPMMLMVFLVIMLIGLYIIAGKISEGMAALSASANTNQKTMELAQKVLGSIDNIQTGGSGIVPAPGGG